MPASNGEPSSHTLLAGSVELTPAERSDVEDLNERRRRAGVPALVTSPQLQAISEARTREMAQLNAGYAGHDVAVDIKAAGYCVRAQREISGLGSELATVGAGPGEGNEQQEEVEFYEIETNPTYKLLGDSILETPTGTYAVEDFATPC